MSSVVLDASAILAFLHREAGASFVEAHVAEAVVSAVNVAEVGARLSDWGMSNAEIRRAVTALGIEITPFDDSSAYASAALRPMTRDKGLSLGDRACLALATHLGVPALTADRAWTELQLDVEVRLIRE